jgi:acyl-CoA reductase-like NAD-dependent aldehyde dehydrogenase
MSNQEPSSSMIKTISPVDGAIVVERKCQRESDITSILSTATKAFKTHKRTPLTTRLAIATKFLDLLEQNRDELVAPR